MTSIAWVSKVFASSTKLLSISAMRQELVLLITAFFDARSAIIPNPPRPHIPQESQDEESQDYYGAMEQINYDDPELAIALAGHQEGLGDVQELESKMCTVRIRNTVLADEANRKKLDPQERCLASR